MADAVQKVLPLEALAAHAMCGPEHTKAGERPAENGCGQHKGARLLLRNDVVVSEGEREEYGRSPLQQGGQDGCTVQLSDGVDDLAKLHDAVARKKVQDELPQPFCAPPRTGWKRL